jgi:hypothetical protein
MLRHDLRNPVVFFIVLARPSPRSAPLSFDTMASGRDLAAGLRPVIVVAGSRGKVDRVRLLECRVFGRRD